VEVDHPLPEAPQGGFTGIHEKIGAWIAEMIPDEATLQLGIGSIPDAVLNHLGDKRDLGVHSELFSDGLIDLVEKGIVTNDKKTLHPGKIIAGFMFGSQRLYEFVQDNPIIEMHPTDYVNDPFIIAQNDKMIAINSAIEVDLSGQVNAEIADGRYVGAVGGAGAFLRGASASKGGLPIVALPATARGRSRIVCQLSGPVSTARADAGIIVTEHGVADLRGLSLSRRRDAMLAIADPTLISSIEDSKRHGCS
jgi:acetyl-CoA hydrolase